MSAFYIKFFFAIANSFLFSPHISLDFNLKTGVTIPAGAVLVVPVHLVQMDDSSWGTNASEFNPYRFLTKSGNGSDLVLNSSPTGFTPA